MLPHTGRWSDSVRDFYAIWTQTATIWVVEQVTESGVTKKRWVKKLNVRKVIDDGSGNKSWGLLLPHEVVEDSSHDKSWNKKQ